MNTSPYIALRITAIREETFDTKSFVLEEVSGKPIQYKPGQFLTLIFNKKTGEERRSYSISSLPSLHEPLTLTIKRVDNGEFSRFLFDTCKAGDILYTIGASGFFTLPDNIAHFKQIFFLAAGSGITPILPLIKTILHTTPALKVYLLYSNHTPETTIFFDQINTLNKTFPETFQVDFLFSSSKNLLKARLGKLLLAEYLKAWTADMEKALFYTCGPNDYMQMVSITLLTEGVPEANIRKEIFNTEKPPIRELPPDQKAHQVEIRHQGNAYTLTVQYPTTILEAAKQKGVLLPYSCEAGKCGTCSATCLEGKVWMSYNEVLLDKELAQGRVLTCVGYPVGGDVVLNYPDPNDAPS